MTDDRLSRARTAVTDAGLDLIIVTPGADLRYLSGYRALPLERLTCLALGPDVEPTMIVPELERPAAEVALSAVAGISLRAWKEGSDAFATLADVAGKPPHRFAVDNQMWAERLLRLQEMWPDAEATVAGPVLTELRIRKTAEEVEELRRAGAAIDRVHARIGEWLRPGRTEREVGADIADAIIAEGHAQVDFVIVGSGPNGASPHHDMSDRVIEPGDPVVIDIGGTLPSGYCSDCTRVYVVGGAAPAQFLDYYAVLQEAQRAACAAVRPGVSAESIDAAARDLISAAGYGAEFVHRTGHGIGLESHEEPYIVSGNTRALEPGMCFSVEPGIYIEGRHGARIEDIMVVTDTGGERLNTGDTGLSVVG